MKRFLVVALAMAAAAAHAQHSGYAGQEGREIKSLSAEEINQYASGAGMGYAKAAELNHFPGPMHVLELADRLGLSAEQRAATRQLMDEHKRRARAIGARLVDSERARLSHLETHRRMRAVLTEEQVKRYDALRGYSAAPPAHPPRH